MDLRLLGPIEVVDDQGVLVPLASTRQRALLAGLCLHAGDVVSTDWLIELLWGDALPDDPLAALQSQISRLRRRLGSGAPIGTVPGGYRMDDPEVIDVVRFHRLVTQIGSGRRDALPNLATALAMWRGRPLAELDYPLLDPFVSALVQDHAAAAEKQIAALIEHGAHDQAATAAKQLSSADPCAERPVALLMEALARSGRPREALETYERFRRTLEEELGLDPSAELRDTHRRVLDASTDPTRRTLPPVPKTSLVGREDTLSTLVELLGEAGLVTLTGPGGVGKTRLAIHAAHAVETKFRDGVWFCDLTALRPAESVAAAVASILGLDAHPGESPQNRIVEFIRPRQALIVLDNCEHVIDSAASLAGQTIALAPGVTVLASSRERLRVPGERCLPVDPLPTASHGSSQSPAIRLFLDRARSANPAFALGPVQSVVAQLCRMLGGLPLAIEIAAARTATRTPADLLSELKSHAGQMLSERGRPQRHASLHAIVAWSADLLDPATREVFERLAVFAGGWHADAARAVAGNKQSDQTDRALDQLTERSLIAAATNIGRTRWRMPEPVRAYAAHHLDRHGETAHTRDRHARFFLGLAEDSVAGLRGPGERHWAELLGVELANLRVAHRWFVDNDRAHSALRLACACYPWVFVGAPAEVAGWAEEAVERFPDGDDPALVGALATAAAGAWRRGAAATAITLASRGVELGSSAAPASRWALDALGDANIIAGHYEQAIDSYRAAAPLAADARDNVTMCNNLGGIALGLAYQGRVDEAIAQADDVLRQTASIDNPSTQGWAHYFAGETRLDTQPKTALPMLRRAVAEAERGGNRFLLGVSLVSLASAQARAGKLTESLPRYRWLIAHWQQTGAWSQLWITVRSLIEALHRNAQPEPAAVLYGALAASPTAPPVMGPDADRLAAVATDLTERFGADHFATLRARGAAMSDAAAISYALATLPAVTLRP